MTTPEPGTYKSRLYRAGLVVVSILVLAASIVGIRSSLRPSATAPSVDWSAAAIVARGLPVPNVAFEDGQGRKRALTDFRGKVVLLNIWATWCAPCRAEMPTLDRLQLRLGGEQFEVVALSIDRGGQAAVRSFYDEIDVRALAIYVDATVAAQATLGVVGVPTTLLIDREGREVARYTGPAQWDRPEVIDAIQRYLPQRMS